MPGLVLRLDEQIGMHGSAITGTRVTLHGLATLVAMVDSPVTVECSWTDPYPKELATSVYTSPPYAAAVTLDPFSVGSVYHFIVTITPSNLTRYVVGGNVTARYTLTQQPYPSLVVKIAVSSGQCGRNETATLTGNASLLPNTATNHTLAYTWKTPDGQTITAPSGDSTLKPGGTLVVNNPRDTTGIYNLTACLTIPGTDVVDHCSSVDYTIFSDGIVDTVYCYLAGLLAGGGGGGGGQVGQSTPPPTQDLNQICYIQLKAFKTVTVAFSNFCIKTNHII